MPIILALDLIPGTENKNSVRACVLVLGGQWSKPWFQVSGHLRSNSSLAHDALLFCSKDAQVARLLQHLVISTILYLSLPSHLLIFDDFIHACNIF